MATDSEKLEQLRKAAEQRTATKDSVTPWQESLSRFTTVPSTKALQAAEVISGLAGGWAAFTKNGIGISRDGVTGDPVPTQAKSYKLGQAGVPEINFAPYNYGSNRFGPKGPSLLGHPISISVVGPTLKTPKNIWQWVVTDNSAVPGVGDVLTIDAVDSALSTSGSSVAPAPLLQTMAGAYKLTPGPVATAFPGGLYMVVLLTGAVGTAPVPSSGLADGFIGDGGGAGKSGCAPLDSSSKYEIFRVETINVNGVTLDPNKRLESYFNIPGMPHIRAVMFFEPHVARMVAVPGSGLVGKEKTFVLVPPTVGATGDLLPPYNGGVPSDGTWVQGGFDIDGGGNGNLNYNEKCPQPNLRPIARGQVRAQRQSTGTFLLAIGTMRVMSIGPAVSSYQGKIFHLYQASRTGQAQFFVPYGSHTNESCFLGWYEVTGSDLTSYSLRRIAEVDPTTGRVFWGYSGALAIDDSSLAGDLVLDFTVHEPMSALHLAQYLDPDKLASARLTNVIDPMWVERTTKVTFPNVLPEGGSPARPDRAIWNTRPGSDPGSLLDLGFRMVLFPAKDGTGAYLGQMVPDYDHPIDSREVVLDSTINESQYLDIDYSAGVVRCSHTPNLNCDIAPNGIVFTDNARREIVLFAACVPYSMEEGQLGAGVRATAMLPGTESGCVAGAEVVQADIFSGRIVSEVAPLVDGLAQTIQSGVMQTIYLQNLEPDFPETGFIDLRVGSDLGAPAFTGPGGEPLGLFGYSAKHVHPDMVLGNITKLVGCFGGGAYAGPPIAAAGLVAVLRRDIRLPVETTGIAGTKYEFDTTYGSAKRSNALHFEDATIQPQPDGSLTVKAGGSNAQALFEDLFSSWAISGGALTFPGGGTTANIAATEIILRGRKYTIPAGSVTVPAVNVPYYFYVDGATDPTCPVYASTTTLPLPDPEDILLARADVVAGVLDATTYINLTNPLRDVDRRVDITVGDYGTGTWAPSPLPHFATLAEAVAYVGEVMSPASGTEGRFWRIKVIGPTVETAVPIVMPTNGIIIEGAALREAITGGGPPSPSQAIQWQSDTALFDLNGKFDLIFRDLAFEYTDAGQPLLATPDRVVFSAAGGLLYGTLITNCRFEGNGRAHGLFQGTGTNLFQVRIENCVAAVTDFGILMDAQIQFCSFNRNRFYYSTAYAAKQTPALSAGINLTGIRVVTNTIQGNSLVGFVWGIVKNPSAGTIDRGGLIADNSIQDTEEYGIRVRRGGIKIRGNYLSNVHTTAGLTGGQPVECGIWCDTASSDEVVLEGNHVTLASPTSAKRAVLVGDNVATSGNRPYLTNNVLNAPVWSAQAVIMTGNAVSLGVTVGPSSHVTSNDLLGSNTLTVGNFSTVIGNNGDVLALPAVSSQVRIHGNRFSGGAPFPGLLVSDSSIEGNYMASGPTVITGDRNSISHNICNNQDVIVTGTDNSIVGNTDVDDLTSAGVHNRVTSNDVGGDIFVNGSNQTVTGNTVGARIVLGGINCVITNNRVVTSIFLRSNTGTVIGANNVLGDIDLATAASESTITGNHVTGNILIDASTSCVVDGNRVAGVVTVTTSSASVLSNNMVTGAITVTGSTTCLLEGNRGASTLSITGGSSSVVNSNNLNSTCTVGGDFCVVNGNKSTDLTVTGTECSIVGNRVNGALAVTGDGCVVDADVVGGAATVTGNACVVDGNKIVGTLTVTGVGNTVTDNEPTTITVVGGVGQIVKGNRGSSLTVQAQGSTVQGNQVTGEIVLAEGAPGPVNSAGSMCSGNTCNSIDHQAINSVLMGNRVLAVDLGAGRIAIRNTVGGTRPGGTILVGNLLGDSTLPVQVYGVGWTTEANTANGQGV